MGGASPPPHPPAFARGAGFALPHRSFHLIFMSGFAPQTSLWNPGWAGPRPGPILCNVYVSYGIRGCFYLQAVIFICNFAGWETWQSFTTCQATNGVSNYRPLCVRLLVCKCAPYFCFFKAIYVPGCCRHSRAFCAGCTGMPTWRFVVLLPS